VPRDVLLDAGARVLFRVDEHTLFVRKDAQFGRDPTVGGQERRDRPPPPTDLSDVLRKDVLQVGEWALAAHQEHDAR
jgi:hypothetical protein